MKKECDKDIAWSQSAVSKIWYKYQRKKGKHTGRWQKAWKCKDRKHKAICLENRKGTKQLKNT